MRIATKSSSRAHRRFSLHRTKHNALRFLFFPRFLPPEKIFSYRSIRIIPALHPPSLSLSSPLPPFWSSRTNLYRARRGDGHATRARRYVSAWALRFGAGSILISIQSRTISSGSTFEENERTRVPGPTLRPSNPPASPLPSALQVGRALRFLNIPSSLGKIM